MKYTWLTIYAVIALWLAPWLLSFGEGYVKTFMSKRMIGFVVTSFVAWILPIVIDKLIPELVKTNVWFRFLIIISPAWLVFLMFTVHDDPVVAKIRKWWMIIWIVLLVLTLLGIIINIRVPTEVQGKYSFNPWEVIKEVFLKIWTKLKDVVSSIFGIVPATKYFVNRNINSSIGQSYVGEVDQYSSRDLGVRFANTRLSATEYRVGDEVSVWTDVLGESFTGTIDLELHCFAKRGTKESYEGKVQVRGVDNNRVVMRMRDLVSVSCMFDTENWTAGYYDLTIAAQFYFDTWGYVQYYFSPEELLYDMIEQGVDPAQEAGISSTPQPIYTNGPVMLGLPSGMQLPIPIDPEDPDRLSMRYGASVQNQWVEGKVASLRHIDLLVPPEFVLRGCDHTDTIKGDKQEPGFDTDAATGYRKYSFEKVDTQGANYAFESVTCFVVLEGVDEAQRVEMARELLSSYDLVARTFTAKTVYLYEISEKTRVNVK